jgi:hypothetical protein
MKRLWKFITKNKRTKLGATGVAVLAVAGSAFAYYMLSASGTGVGSNTLGSSSGSVDISSGITVNVPANLTPGNSADLNVQFMNNSGKAVTLTGAQLGSAGISIDAQHATAGCQASWFSLGGQDGGLLTPGNPVTVPAGQSVGTPAAQLWEAPLQFQESGSDQSSCEGATITVPITLSGTAH